MHSVLPLLRRSLFSILTVSLFMLVDAAPAFAADATPAKPAAIRIKTGIAKPLTDELGVVWQPDDKGFLDGETIARPDIEIGNTKTPSLYRAERYSMTKFSQKVPNGKYTV